MNKIIFDENNEFSKNLDELVRTIGRTMAEEEDRRLRASIIGSKILDFKIEPIPNRKTLYKLYIKTDAQNVPQLKYENRQIMESEVEYYVPSEFVLKVKI